MAYISNIESEKEKKMLTLLADALMLAVRLDPMPRKKAVKREV